MWLKLFYVLLIIFIVIGLLDISYCTSPIRVIENKYKYLYERPPFFCPISCLSGGAHWGHDKYWRRWGIKKLGWDSPMCKISSQLDHLALYAWPSSLIVFEGAIFCWFQISFVWVSLGGGGWSHVSHRIDHT